MEELANKRVVLFSYGSGLASAMYSIRVTSDTSPKSPLASVSASCSDIVARLNGRRTVPPSDFEKTMKLRENTHHLAPYTPVGDPNDLWPQTCYLDRVDDKHRRFYSWVVGVGGEEATPVMNGTT